MYYFLAHFPKIDYIQMNVIREKYDPNFPSIDPHIAVVFPVNSSIGAENLISHIENVLKDTESFAISLSGLERSWDHYLYLTVEEGKDKIKNLHDSLYSGVLAPFWRKDIPYIPHITLGFFADKQAKLDKSDFSQVVFDQGSYSDALKLARAMKISFSTKFDSLTLVSGENKTSKSVVVKEFILKQ